MTRMKRRYFNILTPHHLTPPELPPSPNSSCCCSTQTERQRSEWKDKLWQRSKRMDVFVASWFLFSFFSFFYYRHIISGWGIRRHLWQSVVLAQQKNGNCQTDVLQMVKLFWRNWMHIWNLQFYVRLTAVVWCVSLPVTWVLFQGLLSM